MIEITAEDIMGINADNIMDLDNDKMFAIIKTFEGMKQPHHKTGAANLRKIINERLKLDFQETDSQVELAGSSAKKTKGEPMYNLTIQKPIDEMKSKNKMHPIGVNGFIRWITYGKKIVVPYSVISVLENAVMHTYAENPNKKADPTLVEEDFIRSEVPRITFTASPV